MNVSVEESVQEDTLSGALYQLSPLTITLSLLVIVHNSIIIQDFFKDRAKYVPTLFIGIAISDSLIAQGQLVLGVVSVLVYKGAVEVSVLYKSLYYYMATGLPGYSCSRLFNVALSLTLTVHLVDPFRHLNTPRLKKITMIIAGFFSFLHISDLVAFNIFDEKYDIEVIMTNPYLELIKWFDLPGGLAVALLCCAPYHGTIQLSRCYLDDSLQINGYTFLIAFVLYLVLPPILILVCMVVQVKYLRRSDSDTTASLTSTSRHASTTIILVSLTFFLCHIAYVFLAVIYSVLYRYLNIDLSAQKQGVMMGYTEFTLPLLNAAVYPLILIARKPVLRQRYLNLYRRVSVCFRADED